MKLGCVVSVAVIGAASIGCGRFIGVTQDAPARAVTYDHLLRAASDGGNWLTYSGSYDGRRFSALAQIAHDNVARLTRAWSLPMRTPFPNETSPIVVDGTMYITRPPSDVIAVNAATGETYWEFTREVPEHLGLCCGRVNRGVAVLGTTVYVATIDAHLIALDARTGAQQWDVAVDDHTRGFSITSAPLVVKDMVITGVSYAQGEVLIRTGSRGSEGRGHLDAYDAKTGRLRWRFYTTPAEGERGHDTWEGESWRLGGAPPWMTGTYDPQLNLLYWGVGNPAMNVIGKGRRGDNLYASSVIAVDADTGAIRWHFQFNPHDVNDWDAASVPVLADIDVGGRPRKLLLMAPKNGFFYALDRQTGEFLHARPFAKQTWAKSIDANGRPVLAYPNSDEPIDAEVSPSAGGATNWWSPSLSPQTGLFYLTARDTSQVYLVPDVARFSSLDESGRAAYAKEFATRQRAATWNTATAVRAIRPATGEIAWEAPLPTGSTSGVLTTASGILFVGTTSGQLQALDATNGKVLWRGSVEGSVNAAPVTFLSGGRQFVSIASRSGLYTFALAQ